MCVQARQHMHRRPESIDEYGECGLLELDTIGRRRVLQLVQLVPDGDGGVEETPERSLEISDLVRKRVHRAPAGLRLEEPVQPP